AAPPGRTHARPDVLRAPAERGERLPIRKDGRCLAQGSQRIHGPTQRVRGLSQEVGAAMDRVVAAVTITAALMNAQGTPLDDWHAVIAEIERAATEGSATALKGAREDLLRRASALPVRDRAA